MAHAGEELALHSRRPLDFAVPEFKLLVCSLQTLSKFLSLLFSAKPIRDIVSDHEVCRTSIEQERIGSDLSGDNAAVFLTVAPNPVSLLPVMEGSNAF